MDPPNEEAVLALVRVLKRNAADSFAREDHAEAFATYSEALDLLDHLRMAAFVNVANVIFPINTSPSFLLAYPSLPLSVLAYYSAKRNKAMDPPNEEAVLAPVRVLKRNAVDSFTRENHAEVFATYSEALDLLDHLRMAAFVNVANVIFPINTSPSFLLAYPSLPLSVLAYYSAKRNKAMDPPNEEAVLDPVRVLKRNAADSFAREDHAEAFATNNKALDLLDHLRMTAFVNVANVIFPINTSPSFLLAYPSLPLFVLAYYSTKRNKAMDPPNEKAVLTLVRVLKRNAADSFARKDHAEAFSTYSEAIDLLDHLRMAAFVNVTNVIFPINTSPSFLLAYPSLPLSVLAYYSAKRNKAMDPPNEEAVLAPVRVLKRNAADSFAREDHAETFATYSEALDLLDHLRILPLLMLLM
ncbi:hypothetical protein RJT34_11350 [Clitoria ternatea]|uniref:Uncharacterized protein n=1 Tax=Clitoria ternatea TaxID=43366 RepID=A0AAN9JJS8_CLITE